MSDDAELMRRVAQVAEAHRTRTGTEALIYQAPGRVNLLGEHTDYSGGFCMPAALSFNTLVAISPRQDDQLSMHSLDFGESFTIDREALKHPAPLPLGGHWSSYGAGVAWSLGQSGIPFAGADLTLAGNVPLSAGLSSSASFEVATATALLALANATMGKPQIALACQRAENEYVGAPSGIMDQYIAVSGVRGNALAIDTRALTSELAPIPETLRLVVCNSMVQHSNADGEYGARRREVEEAAHALALGNPAMKQLRDATLDDLVAARGEMSETAFLRARHVITDSQRVLDGVARLRAGDAKGFGALMTAAHVSYRDDFGASCERCDLLVRLAMEHEGCLGSRLTGGGFGGCTVSLVDRDAATVFASEMRVRYLVETGVTADVFVCEIADGAGPVEQI